MTRSSHPRSGLAAGGGLLADRLQDRDTADVTLGKVVQRRGMLQIQADGLECLFPQRGEFFFSFFADNLDPAQVPVPNGQPGRYLALHLPCPIDPARFILVSVSRTFGQVPGTHLYSPQQLERGDYSNRRAAAGPHELVDDPCFPEADAFLFDFFLEYLSRVPQSLKEISFQDRSLNQFFKSMLQGPERAKQITAVHGGDVARFQRLQGLNVVPIQQMTLMAIQSGDGLHGTPQRLDDLVPVRYPKSRAASALSIQSPIFVGLVRIASWSW